MLGFPSISLALFSRAPWAARAAFARERYAMVGSDKPDGYAADLGSASLSFTIDQKQRRRAVAWIAMTLGLTKAS
jgi:hypothetical protein